MSRRSSLSIVLGFFGSLVLVATALLAGVPAASAAGSAVISGQVVPGGGPVQSAPRVYVDFWGWTSDPDGEQDYLKRFLSSIGETPWLATVDQYGVRSMPANLLAGTWSNPAAAPTGPTQSQVAGQALAAAGHFGVDAVADPGNVQIIVATPPGHSPPDFWTYCTYHHGTTRGDNGDPYISYTYLPYLPDIPGACGDQKVNQGPAGHLDGVGIFVGRALAEAITDPQGTGWKDAAGNEIGAKCQWYGLSDITTSTGSFPIYGLWSNAANGCVTASAPPRWSGWSPQPGAPPVGIVEGSAPAVTSWGPGRLDTFVQGNDQAVWHTWYDSAGWHPWESLGTIIISSPAAVSPAPNRINLFGMGTDHRVWQKTWNGTTWSPWQPVGAPPPGITSSSAPAVSSWGADRLDLFVQGSDEAIWHASWNGAAWSSWESLGPTIISGPAAASWGQGRIDVFGVGTDFRIWHKRFAGGAWNSWQQDVGAPQAQILFNLPPAVSSWGPDQLDVFFQGSDWATYHTWWDNAAWSPWQRTATNGPFIVSSPAAVSWSPGRIDLFGIDNHGQVEHRSYQ